MDLYLVNHFKGKYRILPHYDQVTNDIPKDDSGNNDASYADLYIKCANNIEIKHGVSNQLSCFVPAKQRGMNILRQIYQDKIKSELPNEDGKYLENLCNQLVTNDILISAEVLDYEVYFEFKTNMIDYIATLVNPKTSGAGISPFSTKNLPKDNYFIPKEDLLLYQQAIKHYPKKIMEVKGTTREMVDGLVIRSCNTEFCRKFVKKLGNNTGNLKVKEWIHKSGLWSEYCEFLKEGGRE